MRLGFHHHVRHFLEPPALQVAGCDTAVHVMRPPPQHVGDVVDQVRVAYAEFVEKRVLGKAPASMPPEGMIR